jgi:hypothetical protein
VGAGVGGAAEVPGVVPGESGGAGMVAVPAPEGEVGVTVPSVGLAGAAGCPGMLRLCFCASGITSGPFCPQPRMTPARQITTPSCTIFMMLSITRAARLRLDRNFPRRGPVESRVR